MHHISFIHSFVGSLYSLYTEIAPSLTDSLAKFNLLVISTYFFFSLLWITPYASGGPCSLISTTKTFCLAMPCSGHTGSFFSVLPLHTSGAETHAYIFNIQCHKVNSFIPKESKGGIAKKDWTTAKLKLNRTNTRSCHSMLCIWDTG